LIGLTHNVQPIATPNGSSSLASRRHQIRHRRHGLAHGIASGAGWGVVLLATGWLLMAGFFGLSNA
jgi:hypothetical protein